MPKYTLTVEQTFENTFEVAAADLEAAKQKALALIDAEGQASIGHRISLEVIDPVDAA